MTELEPSQNIDRLQLAEDVRQDAIARCRRQLDDWAFAIPEADPLVMDFGLGEFERFGLIEFWLANELQEGYCGKLMFLFAKQACPMHLHRVKHETFCPLIGDVRITLGEEQSTLRPGSTMPVVPNKVHGFTAEATAILMLELSTPCDVADNVFEDDRINQWLKGF